MFAIIDPSIPAILATFGAMLLGFYGIARLMLTQATKDREADREERKEFSKAIQHMATSSTRVAETNEAIAEAVTQQASESADRNGHLAELIVKQADATQAIADAAVDKITSHVANQTVDEQTVKHQTIKEEG